MEMLVPHSVFKRPREDQPYHRRVGANEGRRTEGGNARRMRPRIISEGGSYLNISKWNPTLVLLMRHG